MRTVRRAALALGLATAVAAAGCSSNPGGDNQTQFSPGFAECEAKPNTCNSGPTKPGGTFIMAIEKTLPNWNTFDGDGNTYETAQVMSGVLPSAFNVAPDSSVFYNSDLLAEEPRLTSTSPQTIQYKIKPSAVWSDGTPISVRDFQYFWRSNNGKDCPDCTPAATTGYELITSITGADNDKTVTVTLSDAYPDWKGMFTGMYPAHIAAKAGDLTTPAGLKAAFDAFKNDTPTWSGGPYRITDYQKDVSVTLTPNDKWYGDPKPSLEKVIFRIIEDQAQQTPALQNKEVHALISQPNADMVAKVGGMAGVNYNLAKGPTWEHIDANLRNRYLADVPLRQAIFTAIDRKSIIDRTVGAFFRGAAPLNSHNFTPGAPGYKDVLSATGQGAGDAEKARKILTDAGYRIEGGQLIGKDGRAVPPLRFRFTVGNQLRQQTAELVQAQLRGIGIEIKIDPTAELGRTLSTGDFDLVIYGWVGTPFLANNRDLWASNGGSNYGGYSNAEVDRLLDEASKTLDQGRLFDLLNRSDEIMSREAYNLPLFQKPVFIAVYNEFANIRNNPTSTGPAYNIDEWGLRA
jgi:peptide/nickel transport system substrate-binding protein